METMRRIKDRRIHIGYFDTTRQQLVDSRRTVGLAGLDLFEKFHCLPCPYGPMPEQSSDDPIEPIPADAYADDAVPLSEPIPEDATTVEALLDWVDSAEDDDQKRARAQAVLDGESYYDYLALQRNARRAGRSPGKLPATTAPVFSTLPFMALLPLSFSAAGHASTQ